MQQIPLTVSVRQANLLMQLLRHVSGEGLTPMPDLEELRFMRDTLAPQVYFAQRKYRAGDKIRTGTSTYILLRPDRITGGINMYDVSYFGSSHLNPEAIYSLSEWDIDTKIEQGATLERGEHCLAHYPATCSVAAKEHHEQHGDMDRDTCLLNECKLHYPQA